MRTKTLIARLVSAVLALAQPTWAAANPALFEARHHPRQNHRAAPITEPAVSGVIPRAIQGGNPLQLVNPFAPAKYGTAEENVLVDPNSAGKAEGLKLFSISF
jgi:hypothetical protein